MDVRVEGHIGVGGGAAISVQEGACPWCLCMNREERSMAELEGGLRRENSVVSSTGREKKWV